ncbi:hypothetical protein SPFM9_00272 [Salmonella phage SPFM9]|nr:hypothetical protein SPFM9_00272 [Salmonella phage SPFM9]
MGQRSGGGYQQQQQSAPPATTEFQQGGGSFGRGGYGGGQGGGFITNFEKFLQNLEEKYKPRDIFRDGQQVSDLELAERCARAIQGVGARQKKFYFSYPKGFRVSLIVGREDNLVPFIAIAGDLRKSEKSMLKFTNENGNKPPLYFSAPITVCRTIIEALQDCDFNGDVETMKFSYSFGKGEGYPQTEPDQQNRTRKLNIEPNCFSEKDEMMINQEIFKDKWLQAYEVS